MVVAKVVIALGAVAVAGTETYLTYSYLNKETTKVKDQQNSEDLKNNGGELNPKLPNTEETSECAPKGEKTCATSRPEQES